ncbi:MAG: DUF3137 domain-containing protein [Sulfurimonas sp.]|nr:DUF3137 domain-containing protein [Sulfurimonas sp.]
MKDVSELTNFYYQKLFPTLEKLEDDRKTLRKKIIIFGVIFTLIMLIIALALKDFFDYIIFIYIALGTIMYKFLIKDYTHEFKQNIIKPLIHAIDNNLLYTHKKHISEHLFNHSDLFSTPDRLGGNDYVQGNIDDTNIEFSDIHAQRRHRNSKGRDSWSTIFKGLFIITEFNKNFTAQTVVLPDSAQSSFGNIIGNWLQSKNMARDELVKMDDSEFEKEFVVYSTDQIEARYILSHSLMKRLLTFKQKSSHPLHVSFIGSHIHLAIESNKDMFEPSIFSSLLDYKVAMEYVKTLHLAIGIVEELKLNQKIWSKR